MTSAAPPTSQDAPAPRVPASRSLSPSRAAEFKACPLRYRFRVVDKLPEPSSPAAVRGTLVHSVLERLFDLPAAQRTPAAAQALVAPEWAQLRGEVEDLHVLFAEPAAERCWLDTVAPLLAIYFALEDPRRLEPASREQYVEVQMPAGPLLRGVIDRIDTSPVDGALRVVDYKTGRAPGEAWEAKALFQLKFYALVLWRTRGVVPAVLTLLYLADRQRLTYSPDETELRAFERQLTALWAAVETALATGDFRASPGPLCGWCDHKALCPSFGGTPPPYPGVQPPAGADLLPITSIPAVG